MNKIIRFYLKSKIIRLLVGLLLALIINIVLVHFFGIEIINFYPFGVMIGYFVLKIIFRNDNFWQIKAAYYIAEGIITTVSESKYIVAAIAGMEAFDLFLENNEKSIDYKVSVIIPKINGFFKVFSVTVFGYNFK